MTERFFVSPIIETSPGKLGAKVCVRAESALDWEIVTHVNFDETPGMTLEQVRRLALDTAQDRLQEALDVLAGRPAAP